MKTYSPPLVRRTAPLAALILCAFLSGAVFAQSTAGLASQAAQAMQHGDFSEAEHLYAQLTHLVPNVPQVYSNLGLARYYQKQFEAAESAFRDAIRLDPKLFVPNFFLGKIYFKTGQFAKARPVLEQALKLQPRQKELRRLLAADLVGLKRDDEAIVQYQKVLAEDPHDIDSLYGIALIYLHLGKHAFRQLRNFQKSGFPALAQAELDATKPGWEKVAAEEYRKDIAAFPQLPAARIALGNLLLKSKKWQEARIVFQNELKVDPFSFEALYGLALVALQEGDFTSATRNFNKAVRIRPEFFDHLPALAIPVKIQGQHDFAALDASAKRGNFGAALLLSALAATGGHQAQAIFWQKKARQIRDAVIRADRLRFQHLLREPLTASQRRTAGLRYLHEKRYEEGIQLLSPLLARNRADRELKIAVARAMYETGHYQKASRLLNEIHPQDAEALYFAGNSYRKLSLATMEKLVDTNPRSARAHQLLGNVYFSQQMFPKAQREYETGLKIQPNNDELQYSLGNAYFKQFKFTDAMHAYERAIELDPYDAQAYLMKGSCLVLLRQARQAVPALERALKLDPHLLAAHAELGKAFVQLGQPKEALQHLELAATTDKDGSLHYQLFNLYRKLGEEYKAKQALLISQKIRREKQQAMQQRVSAAESAR